MMLFTACTTAQNKDASMLLNANQFGSKHEDKTTSLLLDVRTPEEFSKGSIGGAVNINWNDKSGFEKGIAGYDKTKPVFVYCLAGARSAAAAAKMRTMGFTEVYELDGGILKWRAAGLPEKSGVVNPELVISSEKFDAVLNSDKLVLVDFYADWCGPCKKMKPWLEEIASEMKDKVEVIRINADDNKALCEQLKIDALPTLILYSKKEVKWRKTGLVDKETMLKSIQ